MASGTIQKNVSGWGEQVFSTSLPITPTKDGFVNIICIPNASTAYLYMRDTTINASVSRGYVDNENMQFTLSFPVIAGHTYVAQSVSGLSSYTIGYTPFL